MIEERAVLLKKILEVRDDIRALYLNLSQYGWDCDEELVTLKQDHALSVLDRYLNGQLTDDDVEDWANMIECREDVGFENKCLREFIHEMANPLLTQPLSEQTAKEWVINLKKKMEK